MRTFRSVKADKLKDKQFQDLYGSECHVCRITMGIIEKLQAHGEKEKVLAALGIPEKSLQELEDADCCDPSLVIRLCDYLGITPPESCPNWKPS